MGVEVWECWCESVGVGVLVWECWCASDLVRESYLWEFMW